MPLRAGSAHGRRPVISVIVYGRNDAHGYNLHRRAALSLNCLAEVLTDPDDEIVFVDYNTPDELPTFVEALADTLTDRCLELLRVFACPPRSTGAVRSRTHLPVVEPVARNAAARRANPSNRWLLSTNTDMIFLPLADESLSEICGDLPDGFYGLPRFELPEWVWERLPRSDPAPRDGRARAARPGPAARRADGEPRVDPLRRARRLPAHPPRRLLRRRRLRRGDAARLARRLEPEPAAGPSPGLDREPRRARRRLSLQPQPDAHRLPRRGGRRERPRPVLLLGRPGRAPGATGDLGPRRRRARGGAGPRAHRSRASPTRCWPRSRTTSGPLTSSDAARWRRSR